MPSGSRLARSARRAASRGALRAQAGRAAAAILGLLFVVGGLVAGLLWVTERMYAREQAERRALQRALPPAEALGMDPQPALAEPPPAADRAGDVAGGESALPAVPFRAVPLSFVHVNGARGDKLLPETMGGGCAFLDLEGDGDQDLLLVNGTWWPGEEPEDGPPPTQGLFRNDGEWRLVDAVAGSGLDVTLYGMGASVADEDGDGDSDVFLTALGPDRLLRNDGTGRFADRTAAAGVAGGAQDWSTGAAFLDLENDGDLDLLVGRYVRWSREIDLALGAPLAGVGRAYGAPFGFEGDFCALYRNEGDGTYTDVSQAAGVRVADARLRAVGKTLALRPLDVDADGFLDVFVANDTTRNFFFHNLGDGSFREEGEELGLAWDGFGRATGAMGVDAGPFRDDGTLGVFVGNFADEPASGYVLREGFFSDEGPGLGLAGPSRAPLTFGVLLLDADLDGRLDLLLANGHLEPEIARARPTESYRQRPQLFWNAPGDRPPDWTLLPESQVGDLSRPLVGRGAACGDLDGDGDEDLLLTQVGEQPLLLRNEQASGHHWLRCTLVDESRNTQGLGAVVELEVDGRTLRRDVQPTRSYLSQIEASAAFGLGTATAVTALRVRWPGGAVQEVPAPAPDQHLVIRRAAPGERLRRHHQAEAHLENGDGKSALAILEELLAGEPPTASVLRNLARAQLLLGAPGPALARLMEAEALEPGAPATAYLTGLAHAREGRWEQAVPLLEQACRGDPGAAAPRFQLAHALSALGRQAEAVVQLEQAVALDPAHSAGWFALAVAARRAGDAEGFRAKNREVLRLRGLYGEPPSSPVALEACAYTKAEPAQQAPPARPASAPARALAVRLLPVEPGALRLAGDARPSALAVLDVDDAGRALLLAAGEAGLSLLAPGGTALTLEGASPAGVRRLLVGSLRDGIPGETQGGVRTSDVLALGTSSPRLYEQVTPLGLRDVTPDAGLPQEAVDSGCVVDLDHDGDLDLALAGAQGLLLLQNDGSGRFSPFPDVVLAPLGKCLAVAAADLDRNGALDLVVARGSAPTVVVQNLRAGRLALLPEPPGPWPAADGLLLDDLDNDGWTDAALLQRDGIALLFGGKGGQRAGPVLRRDGFLPTALSAFDPDNDGWLDLVAAGRTAAGGGALAAWRNAGRGSWPDDSEALGLAEVVAPADPWELRAADLDGDGDSDLLVLGAEGELLPLRNEGGSGQHQLKLRLLSLVNPAGAPGVQVEARRGDFFVSRELAADQPIEIGTGSHVRLDSLQTIWPDGIVHTWLDVPVGRAPLPLAIVERVDTGSCPFLYLGEGQGWRFVNDLVGAAPLGVPLARGRLLPADPWESLVLGEVGSLLGGQETLRLAISCELRELMYLDALSVAVVEHPSELELHTTHMLRAPPFPPDELVALAPGPSLRSALDENGVEHGAALAARDARHAAPGAPLPPPYRGVCTPWSLTLDFGPLPHDRPLVLALGGWLQWTTSSAAIALSQGRRHPLLWPRLEARLPDGNWQELAVVTGLPAGKGKTVLWDLAGKLPVGADALRIKTSYELHLDRVALLERRPLDEVVVHALPLAEARLEWWGFSELRSRGEGLPTTPDPARRQDLPPWRTAVEGWCTAYGDVLPLLAEADDRLVLLNAGDAVLVRAEVAALPAPALGRARTLLLDVVGWAKEGDVNSEGGERVLPLPAAGDSADDAWQLQWNTRWVPADRFAPRR